MRAVFRPTFGRYLTGIIVLLCAVGLVMAVAHDGLRAVWQVGPWLLLVSGLVWATYWRPEVSVDDAGVHLVNVLRSVDLPWPAIQRIDTKWALTLFTDYGRFTAWAAPAPGGLATARAASKGTLRGLPESTYGPGGSIRPGDVPASPSGAAAGEVRRRWEALRDAGHLDHPQLEFSRPPARWHWEVIAGVPVVILIGLVTTLLG